MQKLTEKQAAERAQLDGALEGLNFQRSELQSQQGTLLRRRNQLDEQRHVAPASERAGIERQIADIDARSARIEQQILGLNDQISATLARRTAMVAGQDAVQAAQGAQAAAQAAQVIRIPQISIPPMDFGRQSRRTEMRDVAGFMAAEAVLLGLIGVVFWRFAMRRMRDQFERMIGAQSQQLGQLQNAVDVIGIEVERISEGQRYVAKVLAEGTSASALPVSRKQV
jgi:hypothetical protein